MILPVLTEPNKILRRVGDKLTMADLTTPKMKKFTPDKKRDLVLVNPAWKKTTTKTAWDMEGCLSVPGIYGEVKRYTEIKVTALSETGAPLQFKANKFFCRIIQHEVDHLNGILFIDKARNLQEIDKKTDTI